MPHYFNTGRIKFFEYCYLHAATVLVIEYWNLDLMCYLMLVLWILNALVLGFWNLNVSFEI